jgi:FkbM family methyltransferase
MSWFSGRGVEMNASPRYKGPLMSQFLTDSQAGAGVMLKSPKMHIRRMLQRAGLYHRLRASSIQDLYWRIAGKRWILAREKQLDFYRRLLTGLRPKDLVFDIGANEGFKTDLFLRLGARVVAIDPDETNQSILRERFAKLRLVRRPLVIVGKAVSDKNALETMWIDGPGSAVNTLSQKWANSLNANKARHAHEHAGLEFARQKTVETTTVEQLMSTYGVPVFIKIDVEGYELNVIRGLQRPVAYLSFEVNLPEFRSEGLQCIENLRHLAATGTFNYAVDCEQGLALDRWVSADEFLPVLGQCTDSSIEVFWKGLSSEAIANAQP